MATITSAHIKNSINILQWNSRSIRANRSSLINFLSTQFYEVIVLSETWLQPNNNFEIRGYNFVHKSRNDGYGGVGILISQDIEYEEIDITTNFNPNIEACAVNLPVAGINIISIYRPPNSQVSQNDWQNLLDQFSSYTIFCGDFNAHHSSWGPIPEDRNGRNLMNAIENLDLVTLNDGSPTRISPQGTASAVDLTILSPLIVDRVSWEVLSDTLGSDHYPIKIDIQINPSSFTINPSTKWNDQKADCLHYQNHIDSINFSLRLFL